MSQEAHPNDLHLGPDDSPPLYANFPRRLNALSLDTVVLVVLSLLIFSLASVFEDVEPVRIALVIYGGLFSYSMSRCWCGGWAEPLAIAR